MIESVIAQEATKKIAEKVVEKAAEHAIGYTSNKVEDSLRPQTDNPLSKWEKGTAMFLTGSLSDAALATKMEAAAHSACKFFDLPEPELVEGNSIGVLMDANIFMDKDQFSFNLDQFKDMKCLSFEDMSKIWAHECGHCILKREQISVWSQELGADFFMGVRSEMLGLPSSEIEKVLASQSESSSHPYGELRAQAIKEGREYVKECNLKKEPVTVQGCKDTFLSSKLSKIPVPDSTTKHEFAAFVNDKSYHLEKAEKAQDNATYYSKEAEKAAKKGDLSRAKDMQRKAENYESKVKEEKKSAEMSKLVDAHETNSEGNEIRRKGGSFDSSDCGRNVSKLLDIYMNGNSSISDRVKALKEICRIIDDFGADEGEQKLFQLPQKVHDGICELGKACRLPQTEGSWTGEPGNSSWIPNDDAIPKNKYYNNIKGKTWRQIKQENGIDGIQFKDGVPDFSNIAKEKVEIDFPANGRYVNDGEKGVHELAFAKMAEKRGWTIEDARAYKEKENLVWHEDADCKTVLLIPREIHDNIPHIGGIALAKIVEG